jgi:FKBP-type peptidyl-prolyl cis-trans isomerase
MTTRLVLAVLAVLAVGFIACGDDDDAEGETITTDSGLQITDIEVGSGEEVEAGDTITVHYTGWLDDGTVFDSSVERGQPATFPLSGLIPGWQEGIPGMKEGGKRRLVIPPELAYGESGSPPAVPPNAELTFEIEVLSIH